MAFMSLDSIVNLIELHDNSYPLFAPKHFKDQILNEDFARNFQKDHNGAWVYDNEFQNIEDKFVVASFKLVHQLKQQSAGLLQMIKSIPELKFNPTVEQEAMISTPSDILTLGRSGTGKTTSSALRMFATDIIYKYLSEFEKAKKVTPSLTYAKFEMKPEFILKPQNLRLGFVTASPVLTNEVKKYFEHVKGLVKKRLIMKQRRRDGELVDLEEPIDEEL